MLEGYWPPPALLCSWMSWTSLRLVSRKRSTQLKRQDSSEREKRVEGVPVTHLCVLVSREMGERFKVTHLSQHMLVILWTDSWTRAWACSCSMNCESSFWDGG
jgi:hypothetical protein